MGSRKILNKRKIRGVEKYLVQQKGFTTEGDTWKKKKDLKNTGEALEKFKERMSAEVRRQEKIDIAEERDFRRGQLLGKFMAKMLYRWDDKKFEDEYLKKLEKNWKKQKEDRQIDKSKHLKTIEEKMEKENEKIRRKDQRNLKEGVISRSKKVDLTYFIFLFIFIFIFYLFFYFLFLEQLGSGLIGHKVTTVT